MRKPLLGECESAHWSGRVRGAHKTLDYLRLMTPVLAKASNIFKAFRVQKETTACGAPKRLLQPIPITQWICLDGPHRQRPLLDLLSGGLE